MNRARVHIALLAVLAFGLVGRGVDPGATSAQADVDQSALTIERIAAVMGDANPVLSENQAKRIGRAVLRGASRYDLDPQLIVAIILVESGARPWVRSPKGAVGLMQVMPHMAAPLDLRGSLVSIEHNVEAGCFILADNIRRLGEEDGISAYFWGSQIRGVAYLDRVRAARASVRARAES